ncbi:MAG: periplasmic protein [Parcubacteria group bacterium Gr01-1014_3]|nr:MAG: periplasmic protein [Parcubacteria group bacterium Gr01-1014_3]
MRTLLASFLFLIVTVVILVVGQFIFDKNNDAYASTRPWVDIIASKVFLLNTKDGVEIRELNTGDELLPNMRIKTDATGLAEIHFADGSVARLDSNTELILEDGRYDIENQSLVVRINLLLGRVWSKVVGLSTPESAWEVKTSNAVATVRGTAFGMEFTDGISSVIGSENQVAVTPIDPDTKKAIKEAEVLITAEKFVEISAAKIKRIKEHVALGRVKQEASAVVSAAGELLIAAEKVPARVAQKVWIGRGKKADRDLEDSVKELKKTGANEREIFKEVPKTLKKMMKAKKVRPAIKELENEVEKELIRRSDEIKKKTEASRESDRDDDKEIVKELETVEIDVDDDVELLKEEMEIEEAIIKAEPVEKIETLRIIDDTRSTLRIE